MRAIFAILAGFVAVGSAGCATVRPWEREFLAKRSMQVRFGEEGAMDAQYWAKVTEAVTDGGLPGDAPGGGCGCTQ